DGSQRPTEFVTQMHPARRQYARRPVDLRQEIDGFSIHGKAAEIESLAKRYDLRCRLLPWRHTGIIRGRIEEVR
ncbi:MAG: hypothetical protein ACRELV_05970, partial [Longimicrobiales bacterium]